MIVCDSGRFAVLMNPKTGTTALSAALAPWASLTVQHTPGEKHMGYATFLSRYGSRTQGYAVYCAVRPPLDTLWSWYRYRGRAELADPIHPRHANYTGGISFEQFLAEWESDRPPSRSDVGSGSDFVLDESGSVAPMRIFRYSSLDAMAAALSDRLGQRLELPRLNISPGRTMPAPPVSVTGARLRRACDLYESIGFVA